MGVKNSELSDLLHTTLKDLPKDQFEQMWDHQNYPLCQIYKESSRKIDGGTSIQRNVVLDRKGRARYRNLYDTDSPTVDNIQHEIDVPWVQLDTSYSWDVLEIRRNKGSGKGFINLLQSRRGERMWDLAELIEDRGWLTPTSATDKLYPYGIPYYLNYLANGSSTGGFHGQTIRYQGGTTGTICAGIDAGTESKWCNYADTYTTVDNGLLRTLRTAIQRTRFRPPASVPKPGNDAIGPKIQMFADDPTTIELADLADKRDDNNTPADLSGKVLHSFEGAVHFNKIPIIYTPQLDGHTVTDGGSNQFAPSPIYCVDWSKLQPVVQDGYWMEEGEPIHGGTTQHTVFTVFLDGSHNNLCLNRRSAGFVLHKVIPAA